MLGVGGLQCCVRLQKVSPVSNFAQELPTTCNRVCKRTQHVTSNNIWGLLVNNVGSVCTELKIVVRVELRVNETFT